MTDSQTIPDVHSIARDQLRAFVQRVERIEEEIKTLNDDKSDIYKEAAAVGFDKKTLKKVVARRKVDDSQRQEEDALFEMYWDAVHDTNLVHARVRENIEEFDAETGEILDGAANAKLIATVATGMQTEIGRKALVTALDIMIDREEEEERRSDSGLNIVTKHTEITASGGDATASPSLTTREAEESVVSNPPRPSFNDEACLKTFPQEASSPAGTGSELLADREGRHDGEAVSADLPTIPEKATVATQGEATEPTSDERETDLSEAAEGDRAAANAGGTDVARSATRAGLADPTSNTGEGAANTALPDKPKVSFRPNCQHPENCASGTRDHCWSCRRAMQKSEEAA